MGADSTKVKEREPRFLLLVIVCLAVVLLCGFLAWFTSTFMSNCCP